METNKNLKLKAIKITCDLMSGDEGFIYYLYIDSNWYSRKDVIKNIKKSINFKFASYNCCITLYKVYYNPETKTNEEVISKTFKYENSPSEVSVKIADYIDDIRKSTVKIMNKNKVITIFKNNEKYFWLIDYGDENYLEEIPLNLFNALYRFFNK